MIVMLDRLGIGKQLFPMREQVARGVGVLLDLDDLGPVVHQVHTINGRAILAEHLEHLLLKLHGLQILLKRLLLFFQQRQHAQVLPRAAEVPADKGKQSELAGRHRPLRIVKAEKAAQIAAIEDRHHDLGVDALRLQDLVLARHLRFHVFNIRNDDRLAAAEDLQPVRHIRGNDLRQVVDLRRDAVRAPLKGVAIGLRRPLQPLEEKHAVRLHGFADQTQQAVDQFVHLLLAAGAVDTRELIDERKAVFCRTVRPCGHGRMFCLLHALVSFAAAFDTCHKYTKLVIVCLL